MELKQGTLLQGGKYKIEATLGQGSFGITYLGTARFTIHGGLGAMEVVTKVAIKEFFMHEMNVRDRDGKTVEGSSSSVFTNYRHRFRREAENLAKLNHPNIIRVYDVFDENGTTYYSMEYVEGLTLDAYIQQHHPLPEADAVAILGRVCSALSFMHSQRMLHLDLKPKNIMCSTKGEVFLIDFGLSKQFGANGEPESSTTIGAGTPGYAPIEQVKQIKDGTFPATLDIYALGATIYKTLTGQRPPEATDILNDGFPDGPLVQLHRSPSLIKVIARCMSPMRKDRYQTVADLLRAYPALAIEDEKTEIKEDTEATILDDVQPVKHLTGTAPVPPPIVEEKVSEKLTPKKAEPVVEPKVIVEPTPPAPPKKPSTRKYLLWSVLAVLIMVLLVFGAIVKRCADNHSTDGIFQPDSLAYDTVVYDTVPSDSVAYEEVVLDTVADAEDFDYEEDDPIPRQADPTLDFTVNGVTFTMVLAQGGTFTMGATSEQTGACSDEKPAHRVTLSDYYIGQTEVTQALWEAVMGYSPTSDGFNWEDIFGLGDNYPAYQISYNDVLSFISKLNSLTGRTFRMPTEAEWEYAARGGNKSKGYRYSGGNTLDNVGWYYKNRGSGSHPVAQKSANELGLYDMSGNVEEWCSDWFDTYSSSSQTNPTGPSRGSNRVLRGGGWDTDATGCRVAGRRCSSPSSRNDGYGVRLALSSSH
ncbi:MAG: bifunctional serine/threonine-protein kinase/formylglycine-generating enzyme family protein [Bacteroidales bacterium]|nr:bifunctional serine/threonine-protein kinase/formylglycine-generating enzyme family protein [Bacteroidales bacterium]